VDALNNVTTVSSYNSFGEPMDVTVASGTPAATKTTYTYDSTHGNVMTQSTPWKRLSDGSSLGPDQLITYNYDQTAGRTGDLVSVTDPNQGTWYLEYDAYGNRRTLVDPMGGNAGHASGVYTGDKTTFVYDNVGRIQSKVSPKGYVTPNTPAAYTTAFGTDAFGALTSIQGPLGAASKQIRTFDPDHNVYSVKDANQHTTTYTIDPADQVTAVNRPDGTSLQTGFFGDGSVASQTDGAGVATSYVYDPAGNATSVVEPSGTTTYGYDGAGRVTTKQDPNGNCATSPGTGCTRYGWWDSSQLKSVTYSDGTTPNVTAITYDAAGHRLSMTDRDCCTIR